MPRETIMMLTLDPKSQGNVLYLFLVPSQSPELELEPSTCHFILHVQSHFCSMPCVTPLLYLYWAGFSQVLNILL